MNQEVGINFPLTGENKRSTTVTAKRVLSAALRAVDAQAAAEIAREAAWRKHYPQHYRKIVEVGLGSPEAAQSIAATGLEALYKEMVFVRGMNTLTIQEAMEDNLRVEFHSAVIEGQQDSPPAELTIPYAQKSLSGDDLLRQIDDWETRGIIEPSCGAALRRVQANPEWLDLADQKVVLLGAAAEMGPFMVFSRWRADVVAVDLNRPQIWERLIATARAGNGRLTFPLREPSPPIRDDEVLASQAGADLIGETPEIGAWLAQIEGPVTVGGYAYLDGGPHVRVALAMDALMQQMAAGRDDVTLALLHTPSDVFAVPREAAEMAQERFEERSAAKMWQEPIRSLSGDHFYAPNVSEMLPLAPGKETAIVDSLVMQQGPNYALAKRLQRWRATVARAQGSRVSSNVAPSTKTVSVLHNLALASAYAGAGHFGVEIFDTETSNALMATLLVHDLRYEGSTANPAVPLDHPAELFMQGANHGGLWRAAFSPRSVIEIAGLLGWRSAHTERKAV